MEYQLFYLIFVFSACSFVCLQAVYQLLGPVCKSTWPFLHASHLRFVLCDRFLVLLKSYNFLRDGYR